MTPFSLCINLKQTWTDTKIDKQTWHLLLDVVDGDYGWNAFLGETLLQSTSLRRRHQHVDIMVDSARGMPKVQLELKQLLGLHKEFLVKREIHYIEAEVVLPEIP